MSNDSWVWSFAQICAEIWYLDPCGVYWQTFVRSESRLRVRNGREIPCHWLASFSLRPTFFERAFWRLTRFWSWIEPESAQLRSAGVHISNENSWTRPQARGLSPTLRRRLKRQFTYPMDVPFRPPPWSTSLHLARAWDELNLDRVLGFAANISEFYRLLGVIESTNYAPMPSSRKLLINVHSTF